MVADAKGKKKKKKMICTWTVPSSAGLGQAHNQVGGSPAILSLGVGDGTVLLPEMKPQLTLVSEVQVTFFTMIRLLSGVNAHVALERLKVAEVRSTDLTGVRLLPRVNQHMGTKMGHLDKPGATRLTLVRLLS